jgi:broad specificity phosphatase PhoE
MDRLHEKGCITDLKGNREPVHLSAQGMEVAKRLAGELFNLADESAPKRQRVTADAALDWLLSECQLDGLTVFSGS